MPRNKDDALALGQVEAGDRTPGAVFVAALKSEGIEGIPKIGETLPRVGGNGFAGSARKNF